ncbi:MAG: ribose-phosphate pyrophosphokinase [Candidatus Dadabacteria bacterium]|nr:MAG: ribose-phosphate pyrophosphokinase [Candidatus Dadabacteria bacterium]
MHNVRVFTGNANRPLAEAICRRLGLPLGRAVVRRFSDGEVAVEIEESVRGWDVFVIQPTCPPVNDHLMELLVMMDALKRASAGSISVVMPYYGYARQDRKVNPRVPITAKLVADLITVAGADRILTVDLHAGQIQGFFDIPVDNLYATPVLLEEFRRRLPGEDMVVVSPDAGGVERARAFAKRLDAGLAIIDKRREKANVSEVMHIIGEVEGRDALLLDDMIDTAGTLTNAARALKENGARRVFAAATHPVLSGPAVDRIVDSPLEQVVVTDTIPLSARARESGKIHAVTVAGLLAEAIRRITECGSVSSLFV